MSAQPQSPNITDFPVEEVTCLPMPRTSWCEDLQRTTVVEEFIGAESFTAALRGLEWGPASLIAELSGPGWSTVLLLQPTGFSSQMIVTDLDTGLQRTASRGAVAAQLGPFVTSFVVARPRPVTDSSPLTASSVGSSHPARTARHAAWKRLSAPR